MLLDVVHMRLKPDVMVEDRDTRAGHDWNMTMQYVLRVPVVSKAYVSSVGSQRDLWVCLLLKDSEDSRSDFYQQSFGFGIMDQYFEQPPRVYTFSEASVQNLENTSQWTIHILRPEHGHSNDYDAALARQSAWRKQHPESVLASETQKEEHIERWYPGNDFDEAFVAIVGTNHGQSDETMSSSSGYEHEQSKVELTIYHKEEIPDSSSLKAPLTIAELIDVPPVAYGLSRGDDFPYAETAHPMSLSFWSMARLYDPSQSDLSRFESAENSLASPISSEFPFLGDASSPSSPVLSTSEETMYYKAIIQVRLKVKLTESKTLDDIRDVIGLLGELQGLLELRALKRQDDDTEMSFFAIWETAADLATFGQSLPDKNYEASDIVTSCTITHSWSETSRDLDRVDREWSPEKILELVEFKVSKDLSASEKDLFIERVFGLWNTMFSAASHGDDNPVAAPKDPFWTDEADKCTCLFLITWDGQAQREAWLRNFVSRSFEVTGVCAYALSSSSARSTTFDMETIYTPPAPPFEPREPEEDDMGF